MAKSREAVKFSQILEMSRAGSDEIRNYIQSRIEDTHRERDGAANGPEKLLYLLKKVSEGLDVKKSRKDATEWLVSKDETRAAKLLVETRAALARVDDLTKEKGDVLVAERIRAEILAALMEYVLAVGQKQKHSELTPMYVDAIKKYGTDADRALLADAGYGSGVANTLGSFFSFGESEADKRSRAKAKRTEIQVVMEQKQNKPDRLAVAVSNLAISTDAFATLFEEKADKIVDDLTSFALDSDNMDTFSNASLLQIAASLEPIASFINKVIHEIGIENDPPLDQRLMLYRKLLAVHELLIVQRQKLAGIMLERLKMLDENVIAELDPARIDFSRKYECDKRIEKYKQQGVSAKTLEMVREGANKLKGKRIDTLDTAAIIKYQAYIAKCGSKEQKEELHGMQAIHLGATQNKNWLQVSLDSWNMTCPVEIQSALLNLQEKYKYFGTNAELAVLKKLLEAMLSYKNKTTMLNILQYAASSSLITTKDDFANFSRLAEDFKYMSALDQGKDGTLERLVKMCKDSNELSALSAKYLALDPPLKQKFLQYIEYQNREVEPHGYVVNDFSQVASVLSLLETGKNNASILALYDAMFEKFKNKGNSQLLWHMMSVCGKLSVGQFVNEGSGQRVYKSPQYLLECLPSVDSPELYGKVIREFDDMLKDKPLLRNFYVIFSRDEINQIIKDGFGKKIETPNDFGAVIAEQHAAIGEVYQQLGNGIYEGMVAYDLIDFKDKKVMKEAAVNVIELIIAAKSMMDAINLQERNYEDIEKKLNEFVDIAMMFKRSWGDNNEKTRAAADFLVSDLVNQLFPRFTQQADKKLVMLINLAKAVAKTPIGYGSEGKAIISSTLNLSKEYKGEQDGEQKLMEMVTKSLRLVHEPNPKTDEINAAIKSLHDFESSAKFKGLILRFARSVMTLIGKVSRAAEDKRDSLHKKVGMFEAKVESARTMREKMEGLRSDSKQPRS